MRTALRMIVLFAWVAMIGVLHARVQQGTPPPPASEVILSENDLDLPGEFTPGEGESDDWFAIYDKEAQIGAAHHRTTRLPQGFRLEDRAVMKLALMGATRVIKTRVSAETDAKLALRRFEFQLRSGSLDMAVDGTASDGALDLRLVSAGGARSLRVPIERPVVLSQTLQAILGQEDLQSGQELRYELFDPTELAPSPVTLKVGELEWTKSPTGMAMRAFRVLRTFRGSTSTLWVERNGRLLREEGPLGLTLVRTDRERATARLNDGQALDLASSAAIPVDQPIVGARDLARLTLRIDGAPGAETLSFPPRQVRTGDRITVLRAGPTASYDLPAGRGRFAADLAPSPLVESDDPRIAALAAEILDGERDAVRAAKKLLDWVYGEIAKQPTLSIPSALAVLESRRGDCNEHAVLYAALARAAGLPARVVAGTVYGPTEQGGPAAFYYHAWVDVWLGDWVAADPTFGQLPADATHVKLLEGGPERHGDLISLIGQLRFTVEKAQS